MTAAAVSPYAWAGTPAYLKGIEARIVRKVMRALSAAGNPVIAVWDGEEETLATTEADVLALASNLDQCHLYTQSGAWVFIVNGNEWDALSDYNVSQEAALAPVMEWILRNES